MTEKKTLMKAVEEVEEYFLKEGFSANEALIILRELESTMIVARVLATINQIGEKE